MNTIPVVLLVMCASTGIGAVFGYWSVIRWAQRPENPEDSWQDHAETITARNTRLERENAVMTDRHNRMLQRSAMLAKVVHRAGEIRDGYPDRRAYVRHVPKPVRDLLEDLGVDR